MIPVGHRRDPLHDALDIHHHNLDRAGGKDHLLLDETARYRKPSAHQYLVSGAADPGKVYPLGPCLPGLGYDLRVTGSHGQGLGQNRLMPMDSDIDLVLLEDPYVHLCPDRNRPSKHYIRQLGCDHGRPPSIGHRAACGLKKDIPVVLVHPHVGPVHKLNDLAIYAPWHHTEPCPELLAGLGRPLGKGKAAGLLAELVHKKGADLYCEVSLGFTVRHDAKPQGRLAQLVLVFYRIRGFALGRGQKGKDKPSAMVYMGGRTTGYNAGEITGGDG